MEDLINLVKNYSTLPQSNRKKILAYGKTKVGKTRFISSCPKEVFIIDTDGSLDGLIDKNVQVLRISRDEVESGKIKPFGLINMFLIKLRDDKEFSKGIKTLAIDSITMLTDYLMIELMKDRNIGGKMRDPNSEKPTFDEYGALGNRLESIFTRIDDLSFNIYCTAGVKMDKDETTGTIISMPDVLGSFRSRIGHRFGTVLFMDGIKEKNEYVYVAHAKPHFRFDAGIRNWIGDDVIKFPTFDKIFDKKNFEGSD